MTDIRVIESITRVAPLGLRFCDEATGLAIGDGLTVTLAAKRPGGERRSVTSRAGVHVLTGLPGLRAAEHGSGDAEYWLSVTRRRYVLDIDDATGRFVSLRLIVQAPHRGVVTDPCAASPPQSPTAVAPGIPMFSAPGRRVPPGFAVVRASLARGDARDAAGRPLPAAHALAEVRSSGRALGRGLADRRGEVAVVFPWPELPAGIGSPALARGGALESQSWTVELHVRHAPAADPAAPPELCQALAQPAARLIDPGPPPAPVGPRTLSYGRELVFAPLEGPLLLTEPA